MEKTIVVAIEKHHPNIIEYVDNLPFDEQLSLFKNTIIQICKSLESSEKDATSWIIGWCEYGIKDAGSRYISSEQKKQLKETMIECTNQFPKLTIISGTVASTRLFVPNVKGSKKKKEKIIRAYTENSDVAKNDIEFFQHFENAKAAINSGMPFTIVRNTAYVFKNEKDDSEDNDNNRKNGRCIARHDKRRLHDETKGLGNAIFRPGVD